MGWLKERAKAIGHGVEKAIDSATYNLTGKGVITGRQKDEYGIYVGYDNGIPSISTPTFGPHQDKFYNYGNATRSSTKAYKANVAGTAKDILQGGMTKDEILQYNAIHPNEIAGDTSQKGTALNTNTARGK